MTKETKKLLALVTLGLGVLIAVMVILMWVAAIWLDDGRWGMTGFILLIAEFGVLPLGILWYMELND